MLSQVPSLGALTRQHPNFENPRQLHHCHLLHLLSHCRPFLVTWEQQLHQTTQHRYPFPQHPPCPTDLLATILPYHRFKKTKKLGSEQLRNTCSRRSNSPRHSKKHSRTSRDRATRSRLTVTPGEDVLLISSWS